MIGEIIMTTEMEKFDPLGFASEGQIKNAEKLLKQKDSAGEPKVRRANFQNIHPDDHSNYGTYHEKEDYFENTWIVIGSERYVVQKTIDADGNAQYECSILDQDDTKKGWCVGYKNAKEWGEGKKAKICKHCIACVLLERKQ